MATFSAVTRQHILTAIAEYDDRGAENFLGVYGFSPTPSERLLHEGREYDARAVLGVAHKHATGRTATAEELADGKVDTVAILHKREFEATGPVTAAPPAPAKRARAAAPRSTTPRAPRAAAAPRKVAQEEKPPAICPTCFMTLPATGVCDSCG